MQSFLTWIAIALNHGVRLEADSPPALLLQKKKMFLLQISLTAMIETRNILTMTERKGLL